MINWKVFMISLITFDFYWFFFTKQIYTRKLEIEIENSEPRVVWKLLSNFSILKSINPTIISYEIISDKIQSDEAPDPELTGFTVVYTEHLVYLPFVIHQARASYEIYTLTKTHPYIIVSNHSTDVLGTTLNTSEIMTFFPVMPNASESMSTKIVSRVEYECQLIFAYYCEFELLGQRELIYDNIQFIFATTSDI